MPRCPLLFLVFVILLSIVCTAQTRGGGGGCDIKSTPTPSTATSSSRLPAGEIEFRTQSIPVQVPTVVTEKYGKHIQDLNKDNFHLFENGKEQKISTFEQILSTKASTLMN